MIQTLPILEKQVLRKLAEETNADIVNQLLAMYVEELTQTLNDFLTYCASDQSNFCKALHKAKNSSATFGALKLHECIVNAEMKIRDNHAVTGDEFEKLMETGQTTLSAIRCESTSSDKD